MTGLEVDDLTVTFGSVTAIESVTFTIDRGEFFTLVGPSGCGKTTTLRAIAGLESLTSGRIWINDEEVTTSPTEDRRVGIVFQHYALFPHMTVRENVAYGLRFHDPPDGGSVSGRVAELLSLVDLVDMGDRTPDELSGGQQQRVALARALAPGPDVLLLDEPLSALDARLRERLRITIRDIQRDLDITTVYVTHDQAEALAISDRVAVMNDGRIEQIGTPEAVYRRPESRFVAEFVGDNTLIEGELLSVDPPRVAIDDLTIVVPELDGLDPGTTVSLSVRPDAIRVDGERDGVEVTVETVEFLGETYRLHCDWNGRDVLARSRDRRVPGERVSMTINGEKVHVV